MKRNLIAVICLMLAASLLFVSCSKKKYYVDRNGITNVAYTDENGETVTDKNGSVIVIQTDANGDNVTDKFGDLVTFTVKTAVIDVNSSGNKISCDAYSLEVPSGWVVSPDNRELAQLRYGSEDSDISMELRYYVGINYEDMVEQGKELIKAFSDNAEKTVINEQEEIKLKDGKITATKFTYLGAATKDGKEQTAGLIVYVFSAGRFTYAVPCGVFSEDDIKNVDFESVINAVEFY